METERQINRLVNELFDNIPFKKEQFNADQMAEIHDGFYYGLSVEQVKTYADPKFNDEQMGQLCSICQGGRLSAEQMKVYANPKFDSDQMEQIRLGFKNGLTTEQVEYYANPKFSAELMEWIRIIKIYKMLKQNAQI